MKRYTIGQIHRDGMLLNNLGKPYSNIGTVSRIVRGMNYTQMPTPHGPSKTVTLREIKKWNKHWSNLK